MGKGTKRYFNGDHNSSPSKKKAAGGGSANQGSADPESRDFYYDDVDEFHYQKDKVYLDKVRNVRPTTSEEEVYGIGSEDDDDQEDPEDDQDEGEDDDMASDISQEDDDEEGYLPSADAWGKRRQAYYSTDFAGDDRADLSGSDVEVAELEEQEAVSLQRRLLQQLTEDDFKLDSSDKAGAPPSQSLDAITSSSGTEIIQKDLSSLNEEEKFELLKQESPELLPLVDEYQDKSKALDECWEPLANALLDMRVDGADSKDNSGALDEGLYWVFNKYELYKNYLLNLQFYFILKAMRQPVENHPVIDRIMSLKKLVNTMEEKYGYLDQSAKRVASRVKAGLPITKNKLRSVTFNASRRSREEIGLTGESPPPAAVTEEEKKRVHWGSVETSDGRKHDQEEEEEEESTGEQDAEMVEKRGVTYEIEKNKGLTPKRKKEQRNPRVKNRSRFKKALHKKKSQVPDARREIQKYGGEVRGIKANLVRSVKLH